MTIGTKTLHLLFSMGQIVEDLIKKMATARHLGFWHPQNSTHILRRVTLAQFLI